MRNISLVSGTLPIVVSMDEKEAHELLHKLEYAIRVLRRQDCDITANTLQSLHDDLLVVLTSQTQGERDEYA